MHVLRVRSLSYLLHTLKYNLRHRYSTQVNRREYQTRLEGANREWIEEVKRLHNSTVLPTRADGDIDLGTSKYEEFQLCPCEKCGGIMKPMVVFFGENIPPAVAKRSYEMIEHSDGVIVAGTSLQVFSAFRLIKKAIELRIPYGIINIGPTRADADAAFKIEDRLGHILPAVIETL